MTTPAFLTDCDPEDECDVWVTLCRRTNDPKLAWLEAELTRMRIPNRRNGESFHAPILEVESHKLDAAYDVLRPVDDLPDDYSGFTGVHIPLVCGGTWLLQQHDE